MLRMPDTRSGGAIDSGRPLAMASSHLFCCTLRRNDTTLESPGALAIVAACSRSSPWVSPATKCQLCPGSSRHKVLTPFGWASALP
jgi:hypothetical protein